MSFFKKITLLIIILFLSINVVAEVRKNAVSSDSKRVYLISHQSSGATSTKISKVSTTKVVNKKAAKPAKIAKYRKIKVAKNTSKKTTFKSAAKKQVIKTAVKETQKEVRVASVKGKSITDNYDPDPVPATQEEASIDFDSHVTTKSAYSINHVGPFRNKEGNKYIEILPSGQKVVLTLDSRIQGEADNLLATYNLPFASLVAIEPDTGRIMALSGASAQEGNGQTLVARSSFPAASLFKMITAAAAVETVGVTSTTPINYRGGTYSLGKHNYLPNEKSDKFVMTIGTAMGKSCNPVFARVALNYLSPSVLRKYAVNFGFGQQLAYDFPVRGSSISLSNDQYEFARTAAGFGDAYISPVHAAAIVAAIGNRGVMMRPYLVEGLVVGSNKFKLLDNMRVLDQSINPSTADEILTMMESTVKDGTARKHFRIASPSLREISVAAKTGTLRGPNPKGTYHWFTAVAPVVNPKIAISALVIDNGNAKINGAGLGRRFLEKIFDQRGYVESAKEISIKPAEKPVS